MADVVLAEVRGQAWLVSGEQYIDDLLNNTLPPHTSIEIVQCESKVEVDALWVQICGPPKPYELPWLIHPGVVNRVRRASAGHNVFFPQWSAMLDDAAQSTIRAAAIQAAEHTASPVSLVLYVTPGSAQALTDLASLRAALIETQLAALHVDASRFTRETRDTAAVPGMTDESQRVDIVVRPT